MFWIGVAVVLILLFGLTGLGARQRRGTRPDQLSRAPGKSQGEGSAGGHAGGF